MSDCFQARRSGIIYKRYGIVLCLLFSSLSVSAAALETGDGSGIALIDSAWHALIEFQRQVNAGVAIHMRALETGNSFTAFFLGLGVAFLYGMLHALGPGHGKFVIMSYFMIIHMAPATPPKVDWLHWRSVWSRALARYW